MMAAKLMGRIVRELMPQDLKIEIRQVTHEDAQSLVRYLASVVGRAQGRQIEVGERRVWRADLGKNHKASVEAPSWLWTSVVELLGLQNRPATNVALSLATRSLKSLRFR
jgi:uncharacterized protein (DUF2252 family)